MPDNEDGHLPYDGPNGHSDYDATGGRQITHSSPRPRRMIARASSDYVEDGQGPITSSHMVGIVVVENKFQPDPRLVWNR
jgi:hypothetical protein